MRQCDFTQVANRWVEFRQPNKAVLKSGMMCKAGIVVVILSIALRESHFNCVSRLMAQTEIPL